MPPILDRLERYYDAAPRVSGSAEDFGSVTLFRPPPGGYPYYLRPALGAERVGAADVDAGLARLVELGLPRAAEWVAETTPSMGPPVDAAGLAAHPHSLMVHAGDAAEPVLRARLLAAGDPELPHALAVAGHVWGDGTRSLAEQVAWETSGGHLEHVTGRLAAGRTAVAVAYVDDEIVAVGNHNPVGGVTEIVGVATLPAARGRGAGQSVTAALVADAHARGATTVFLSAADDTAARIYARLGFAPTATAMIAEAG